MSISRVYNDAPRPRALLQDLQDDVAACIEPLFVRPRRTEFGETLYQKEYDVLVTAGSAGRQAHLHTVAFGVQQLGAAAVHTSGKPPSSGNAWYGRETTLATELHVPDGITGELGHLVHTHLVPFFTAMSTKPVLNCWFSYGHGAGRLTSRAYCTPFLLAGDGSVLAGAITFSGTAGGRCWVLPEGCPVPEARVAAALKEFHELDPVAVPGLPKWWETPDWATPAQQRARTTVTDLETEREQLLKDLDQRLTDARGDVDRADSDAAAGSGRLLAADGDDLAHGVQAALETLGFAVRDMDQVHAQGQRREDLRVTDPDAPDWEAIVEVKGYTAGAKVNDLVRVQRWKTHYVRETHRDPDAVWHVVNAFRQIDPTARPTAIPDESDLENLIEEHGVLIDTRDLFRAQRDIQTGALDRAVVRETLRSTTGRWTHVSEVAAPAADAAGSRRGRRVSSGPGWRQASRSLRSTVAMAVIDEWLA